MAIEFVAMVLYTQPRETLGRKTMPRRKSMSSIDAEISALKAKISVAKTRYENLCRDLEKLQQEREMVLAQDLVRALRKSGKTYHELMTFLQSA